MARVFTSNSCLYCHSSRGFPSPGMEMGNREDHFLRSGGWEFSLWFSAWRRGWETLLNTSTRVKITHLKLHGLCVWLQGFVSCSGLVLLQLHFQPDPKSVLVQ